MAQLTLQASDKAQAREYAQQNDMMNRYPCREFLYGETNYSFFINDANAADTMRKNIDLAIFYGGTVTLWGTGHLGFRDNYPLRLFTIDNNGLGNITDVHPAAEVAEEFFPEFANKVGLCVSILEQGNNLYFRNENQNIAAKTAARGWRLARISFKWERLIPTPGGGFDATYLQRLQELVQDFQNAGYTRIIIAMHNYGRHADGTVIGQGGLTEAHFHDAWKRISEDSILGAADIEYDTMNEPVNVGSAAVWDSMINNLDAFLAGLNAGAGIPNKLWYESWNWAGIQDITQMPLNSKVNSVHNYLDSNNAGFGQESWQDYVNSGSASGFSGNESYTFDNSACTTGQNPALSATGMTTPTGMVVGNEAVHSLTINADNGDQTNSVLTITQAAGTSGVEVDTGTGFAPYTSPINLGTIADGTSKTIQLKFTGDTVGDKAFTYAVNGDTASTSRTITTNVYQPSVGCDTTGDNLITNGDFTDGQTGWSSELDYSAIGGLNSYWYSTPNPNEQNGAFLATPFSGSFMAMFDFSEDATEGIYQNVFVEAGKTYEWSLRAIDILDAEFTGNPSPEIFVNIDGVQQGSVQTTHQGGWVQLSGSYTATTTGNVEFRIGSLTATAAGNDGGVDLVEMYECSATQTTPVISATMTDQSDPVTTGDKVVYEVEVTEDGTANADNVTINYFPSASYSDHEYSINGTDWFTITPSVPVIVGNIAQGGTATYFVRSTTGTPGSYSPSVNVDADNDTVSVTVQETTVVEAATLPVLSFSSVADSPDPVNLGDTLTINAQIVNGGSDADNVRVTFANSHLTNVEYSVDGGTTWLTYTGAVNIGTITAGGNDNISFRGATNLAGTATSNLTAQGDTGNTAIATSFTAVNPPANANTVLYHQAEDAYVENQTENKLVEGAN